MIRFYIIEHRRKSHIIINITSNIGAKSEHVSLYSVNK